MRRVARRVRTDERGMTLVEVLVALSIGMVVITAAYAVISGANIVQTRTLDRLDALQRGRSAMERITRAIRAQQCLDDKPAVEYASPTAMQFYSSVSDYRPGSQSMEKRRLEWIPKGTNAAADDPTLVPGNITETVWKSTSTGYPYSFPATPTAVNVLAEDVERETGRGIFNYYNYTIVNNIGKPSTTPLPMGAGGDVDDQYLDEIVMVDIRFLSRPKRAKRIKSFTVPFFNRVSVRTADPTDPTNSPLCTK